MYNVLSLIVNGLLLVFIKPVIGKAGVEGVGGEGGVGGEWAEGRYINGL